MSARSAVALPAAADLSSSGRIARSDLEKLNKAKVALLHKLDPKKDGDFQLAFVILNGTGIPHKDLSLEMGISPATFGRWVRGAHLPPTTEIREAYLRLAIKAITKLLP
ncbi:MAG TPA: hypothetical protein PK264_01275 [Hyphomicrobiaceae bacterium]|nr:hypothetical protein [Hyphomicrobiaceae bacterium]